jgi:hypothetical protein
VTAPFCLRRPGKLPKNETVSLRGRSATKTIIFNTLDMRVSRLAFDVTKSS